jgi:hypothetical protein
MSARWGACLRPRAASRSSFRRSDCSIAVTVYAIYEPEKTAPDIAERADGLVFVKEGFSWPALFVPALWLIYHRMWIELMLFSLLLLLVGWVFGSGSSGSLLLNLISFGIVAMLAFEANDLLGAALERRGYRYAGVALGPDRQSAELSFFRKWLPEHGRNERAPKTSSPPPPTAAPSRTAGEGDEVIGLFPKP